MNLLSKNAKLKKDSGYDVYGLSLAPGNHSGYEVCPSRGRCFEICCLWYRGRTVTKPVRDAMIRRTRLFFDNRSQFLEILHDDLDRVDRLDNPAVRLNVASDIPWEKIDPSIFYTHPNISFYDYTKIVKRCEKYVNGGLPNNYFLTYSWSEKSDKRKTNWLLKNGCNVNIVYDSKYSPSHNILGPLPKKIRIGTKWWNTVDGDKQDVRIPKTDGVHKCILVRAKLRQDLVSKYISNRFIANSMKI
jgi:hypothetical protein